MPITTSPPEALMTRASIETRASIDPRRFGGAAKLIETADEVWIIDDADMPDGHDWLRLDPDEGPSYALLRASMVQNGGVT